MSTFAQVTPIGAVNGTNTQFTLLALPYSLEVYRNGSIQKDSGNDYTLSGTIVTFVFPPDTGDILQFWAFTQ